MTLKQGFKMYTLLFGIHLTTVMYIINASYLYWGYKVFIAKDMQLNTLLWIVSIHFVVGMMLWGFVLLKGGPQRIVDAIETAKRSD